MPDGKKYSKTEFVANHLEEEIRSGLYTPGTRLPSIRDLSEHFNVSRMVMQCAADILESKGLLARSARVGYFVPGNNPQRFLYGLLTECQAKFHGSYMQAFLDVTSDFDGIPVMALCTKSKDMENMLARHPARIFVDAEGAVCNLDQIMSLCGSAPVTFCHRFEWENPLPASAVLSDFTRVTELTLRHFIERGHKRILFLGHKNEPLPFKRNQLEEAASAVGLKFYTDEFSYCGIDDFTNAPHRLEKIFKNSKDAPTAIFSRDDRILFEFTLKLKGLFPKASEMEKVGCYNTVYSSLPANEFSTWNWDWHAFWTKVFNHKSQSVEYFMPEFLQR